MPAGDCEAVQSSKLNLTLFRRTLNFQTISLPGPFNLQSTVLWGPVGGWIMGEEIAVNAFQCDVIETWKGDFSCFAVTLKLNVSVHGHLPLPPSPLIFAHSFGIHCFLSSAKKCNFPRVLIAFQCAFSHGIWLLKISSKMRDIYWTQYNVFSCYF